jgi:hypothetical protein
MEAIDSTSGLKKKKKHWHFNIWGENCLVYENIIN